MKRTQTSTSDGEPSGGPRWTAPFYDTQDPRVYHTSPDCPLAAAVPEGRRHLDVAAMRARLPGW